MSARRLSERFVRKPWGRRYLPPPFPYDRRSIGEIWFEDPQGDDAELLIKFLFTSEKLSIQVHPDDEAARAAGYRRGKDEAWLVLAAEPEAVIGLGLTGALGREQLRQAALDGSIEELIDWRPVKAGDVLCSPAGTIHAIGPGLTIVEVQQNVDLTYRLYDYGRPRELHLDQGIAVADPVTYSAPFTAHELSPGRQILADGPAFVLERWTIGAAGRLDAKRPVWIIPVTGGGTIDAEKLEAGSAWLIEDGADLTIDDGSDVLIAYPGAGVESELLR